MRNATSFIIVFVVAILLVTLVVGGIVMLGFGANDLFKDEPPDESKKNQGPPALDGGDTKAEAKNLFQARGDFATSARPSTFASDPPPPQLDDANLIYYSAPAGRMLAYVSKERKGTTKRPAVVWAHGGFGGIGDGDWTQVKPFHDAGFVVMVPSFRGENRNPGRFEMFFSEVNDLLAAVGHAATLRDVDPDRIYVVGHSSGGTLTLLLATTGTTKVRAFVSIAGLPDTEGFMKATDGRGYDHVATAPFDFRRPNESRLRSAMPFTGAIATPTFYIGSLDDGLYAQQAEAMEKRALALNSPFRKHILSKPDHFTIVPPVIELLCTKIKADGEGIISRINFSDAELKRLFP